MKGTKTVTVCDLANMTEREREREREREVINLIKDEGH